MSKPNNNSEPLECKIVSKVQKTRTNAGDYFWKFWTFFGLPYIWIVITIVWFFLDMWFVFLLFVIAGVSYFFTIFPIKLLYKRKRPEEKCEEVQPIVKARGFSLPSGHTYIANVFGLVLALYFKGIILLICMIILGLMVACSRVYLGVHFLTDIVISYVLAIIVVFSIFRVLLPSVQALYLMFQKTFSFVRRRLPMRFFRR